MPSSVPRVSRLLLSIGVVLVGVAGGCGSSGQHADSGAPDAGSGGGAAGTADGGAGTTGGGGATGIADGGSGGAAGGAGGTDAGLDSGAAGTTGDAGPPSGPPIPIADFSAESIKSACGYYARCGIFPDEATCVAVNPPDYLTTTIVADVATGRVHYDGVRGRVCVDAYPKEPCSISAQYAIAALPDPCAGVFTGMVAAGQPCYTDSECAGGGACVLATACTMACCAGTCAAPAAQGESCAGAPCPDGTYCRPQVLRCTPRSTIEGSVCDALDGCAPPLFCVADAAGGGSCVKTLPATGAPCNAFAGCDDLHDTCAASGVCAKRAGLGQRCTTTPSDNCVYYGICNGTFCQAGGVVGDDCASDPTTGATSCLGGLACPTATAKCTTPTSTSCR